MVKRAMNRAPSPRDPWWPEHRRTCGGTYHKVREPEDYGKKKRKKDDNTNTKTELTKGTPKIYDLWKKESDDKSKTNGSDSNRNTKPNDNKINTNSKGRSGEDLSTNSGTKINKMWKVENDNGSGKENDVQKINLAFTPFTGKGHVLGSVKGETSTNSVKKQGNIQTVLLKGRDVNREGNGHASSFQSNGSLSPRSGQINGNVTSTQSNRKAIDINEDDFVAAVSENTRRSHLVKDNQSNLGTKRTTKSNSITLNKDKDLNKDAQHSVNTQLTIVDAFKNVAEKKIPLVVIHDTPTKSASSNSVQCPVCLLKIGESQINVHLDACLS
jgi:hypothetical protein